MRAALWLLRRVLPAEWAESVAGDLAEERAERQEAGRNAGALWAIRAAVITVVRIRITAVDPAGGPRMSPTGGLFGDVRYAFRTLRATPGFTLTALIVLALGIGASAAIFSVVDATLLRPLPFDEADRLVAAGYTTLKATTPYVGSITAPDYADWLTSQHSFESLGASVATNRFVVRNGDRPEALVGLETTASLFTVLRVRPSLGRLFTEANEHAGQHQVALISDGLWRRRFGADPGIIGRALPFDDGVYEVIGVMPPAFAYPVANRAPVDIFVPFARLQPNDQARGGGRNFTLRVVGRLKPGVTIAEASAEIRGITARLAERYPKWLDDYVGIVRPLRDSVTWRARSWMLMILGTVGVVLAIVCANVANLMLVRVTGRTRELGIRAALGASRWRLSRALLVESMLLSAGGLAGATLIASWGVRLLQASLPPTIPRLADLTMDARVLAAAAVTAAVTGALCGLAPMFQFSKPQVAGSLNEGGRSAMAGRDRARVRSLLVVVEVALAVVLLTGAGLFVSSFARAAGRDLGFDYHGVLTVGAPVRVDPRVPHSFDDAAARTPVVMSEILERVRAIPGVEAAAVVAGGTPLTGSYYRNSITVPGKPVFDRDADQVDIRKVTPSYAAVTRANLRRGRYLTADDRAGAPLVAVINEEAVRRFFDGKDPVGTVVNLDDADRQIVGVVSDVRLLGPEAEIRPEAYLPFAQTLNIGGDIVVRAAPAAGGVAPAMRDAVQAALPGTPVNDPASLESLLGNQLKSRKFTMLLVGLFGALAAVIAAVGIYGVMAFAVAQQRREIGVRMALGASPVTMLRMVLSRATLMIGGGAGAGLTAAWLAAGSVRPFLFGVQPHDPMVYVLVVGVLAAAGLAAAVVPAVRASRVDPIVAMRAD